MSSKAFKAYLSTLKKNITASTTSLRETLNTNTTDVLISEASFRESFGPELAPLIHKEALLLRNAYSARIPKRTSARVEVISDIARFRSFRAAGNYITKLKAKIFKIVMSAPPGTFSTEAKYTAHRSFAPELQGGTTGTQQGHSLSVASSQILKAIKSVKASKHEIPGHVLKLLEEASVKSQSLDMEGSIIKTFNKGLINGVYNLTFIEPAGQNNLKGQQSRVIKAALIRELTKNIDELYFAESSPSLHSGVVKAIFSSLDGTPLTKKVYKTNAKTDKDKKSAKRVPINVLKVTADKKKLRNLGGRFTNVLAIKNLINAKLHDQVRSNMGSPALNYQSGRFAKSAEVVNVQQTRTGMVSIFYTYMKNPYQTFEPGYAQGSVRRDPNRLISKSIREIATGLVTAKLRIQGTNQ